MKTYRTITAVELEYPRVRDKALWILNSGVVIDLGTGFHLDYIRSHLSEFGMLDRNPKIIQVFTTKRNDSTPPNA